MSKRIDVTRKCWCGKDYTVSLYRSLWVEYPENLQMIMDEKVNVFHFACCDTELIDESPFMVTNVQKSYALWFDPYHDELVDKEIATYVLMFGPRNFYTEAPRISDYQEFKATVMKYERGELKGTPLDKSKIEEAMRTVVTHQAQSPTGLGNRLGRFFQNLFGSKSEKSTQTIPVSANTLSIDATLKNVQRKDTLQSTSVAIVWQRNEDDSLTGNGVQFDEQGRSTLIVGKRGDVSFMRFWEGARLRRNLTEEQEKIAAKWMNCPVGSDSKFVWDLSAEQCFAEAHMEYSATVRQGEFASTDIMPPKNLRRPALTKELITLFHQIDKATGLSD